MKKKLIILTVLAAVLVGAWMFALGIIPFKIKKRPVTSPVKELAPFKLISSEELREKAEETILYFSNWVKKEEKMRKALLYHKGGRDPLTLPPKEEPAEAKITETGLAKTRPTQTKVTLPAETKTSTPINPPQLSLKGIAWDETRPLAFVNNQIVKEGDTLQDFEIVRIDFKGILIRYQSKEFFIEL
ncbi:hypothetical protein KAV79_06265 [Candidatus Aerophobetes bacterium]|nr:hypothetical protein [Candidatus Aerophobetes bacterium]